ncbi:Gfo/Idh/MocA family protein [Oceaniglobus ichthyenteri]|uniref:Gfo/Idh/MocA family protein n=1 Tax=Oceaniglobus ichthyenteri TaxID=2136177 RepID=UPI001F0CB713|nr:Gfo/Idh/MocA family oxidoreductase [Oceaniglobus ichthyenteri]
MANRGGDVKRIGVVGLGLIGSRHARVVLDHPGAELAAVIDPDAGLRAGYDAPGFGDLADVDVPLDGVILATPSALHADHACVALARGWPCIVEKPLASDLAGADRIVAAQAETGLPVLTGHHRRYHNSVQELRDMVQGGAIGTAVMATDIWGMKKPDPYFDTWRKGADGSPVMINMVHDIDTLRFVLGDVAEVQAMGGACLRGADRVESGILALRFANGAVASIAFSDNTPSPWGFEAGTGENFNIATTGQDMLFITGTKGAVSFPSLTLWRGATDWSQAPTPQVQQAAPTVPLVAQLTHFLAVIDGTEPPLIDARDARETLAVTLAAQAALERQMGVA